MKQIHVFAALFSIFGSIAGPALAEFQCAPKEASPALPESDKFFSSETVAWAKTTMHRYTEGSGGCSDVAIPGYEGFPTKRCSYSAADAGDGEFHPLKAEVIVLNPSSRQLAAWSINACRTNGAADNAMPECLKALRGHIILSNGAQFPVVGSVVESYCNSSIDYGACDTLKKTSEWRRPRNTWFRDGVSIDYKDVQEVKWDDKAYSHEAFDAIFNVTQSDANLNNTFAVARIAAARRPEWVAWRRHANKPEMPDGAIGTVAGQGWLTVAASVQKAACRSATNELFDAVVFAHPKWTKP